MLTQFPICLGTTKTVQLSVGRAFGVAIFPWHQVVPGTVPPISNIGHLIATNPGIAGCFPMTVKYRLIGGKEIPLKVFGPELFYFDEPISEILVDSTQPGDAANTVGQSFIVVAVTSREEWVEFMAHSDIPRHRGTLLGPSGLVAGLAGQNYNSATNDPITAADTIGALGVECKGRRSGRVVLYNTSINVNPDFFLAQGQVNIWRYFPALGWGPVPGATFAVPLTTSSVIYFPEFDLEQDWGRIYAECNNVAATNVALGSNLECYLFLS